MKKVDASLETQQEEVLASLLTLLYDIHQDSVKYRYDRTWRLGSWVQGVTRLIADMYVYCVVDGALWPLAAYPVTNRQTMELVLATKITKTRSR